MHYTFLAVVAVVAIVLWVALAIIARREAGRRAALPQPKARP